MDRGDAVRALKPPAERWPWRLAALGGLALICALAGLHAARPISNPDFGWHVALGRWILEHGAVPDFEPFTHTARGAPMVAHQWLSQLLYAASIHSFDVLGLRIANGALASGLVALLYFWLRREGAAPVLALLAVALWATIAETRLQLRPHMANVLCFMLAYGALFVRRARLSSVELAGFFAFQVVWTNLHSGAVLLPALLLLHALTATIDQRLLGRRPCTSELGEGGLGRLWVLTGLGLIATLLTPNHFRIIPYVIESGRINADLSVEWLSIASPQATAVHGSLFFCCFSLLYLLLAVVIWRGRRTAPLPLLAVVLFVAALPFGSQRFTWATFVPLLFVVRSLDTEGRRSRYPAALQIACMLLALSLAGATFARSLDMTRLRHWLTSEGDFRGELFPGGAMSVLEAVDMQGNLFNANMWGGYILFRTQERYPIFVDGRWVTIGERVVRDSRSISLRRPGFGRLLDQYRIEILLVHRGWMTEELLATGEWRPVFLNVNSGVYLRAGPSFETNLERCATYYRAVGVPFDPADGFDEERVFNESPPWAREMGVRRLHLDQFGEHGLRAAGEPPRWVPGW
jgi:hypothetical protein